MADVTITNLDSAPLLIQDLYATIPVGGSITTDRSANDLSVMKSLQRAVAAGVASVSIVYSADELASGLSLDSGAPVGATAISSGSTLLRVAMASAGPQEVVIHAVGAMPSKLRVVDAWMQVSTAQTGDVTVQNEAGGSPGTTYLTLSHAATGARITDAAATASALIDNGAGDGLVVRRANVSTDLELYLLVRAEL